MKKLSPTAFLLSTNLFIQGMCGSAGQEYHAHVAPQIHQTINNIDSNFDINQRKSNKKLLELVKRDKNKVNKFIDVISKGLELLKENERFKIIFKNYFNNDYNALIARLVTIALLETDLDNTKTGVLGEKGFFQILSKECIISTKLPGSQKLSKDPDLIIERIKNERGLSWLKNFDYLGIIMIMEDSSDVSYTLLNKETSDKYYQYLESDFNVIGAIMLYHNKGVMLYEIIETLKREGNNNISFEDILDRMKKNTGKKSKYGESRFKGILTNFISINEPGKGLLTGDKYRFAVGYNYANLGLVLNSNLINKFK